MNIDISYDFRKDSKGKDPDQHSPTLRKYHKLLWSKPLPNGQIFTLDDSIPGIYLKHSSDLGDFNMSSDTVIPTFSKWKRMTHITQALPPGKLEHFVHTAYSIRGMMIFPSNQVDGKPTINGERGFNQKIGDRMDLTLECIRRYYLGAQSPLSETLTRYKNFFDIFGNFRGYVEFFLLNDMVSDNYLEVKFFKDFDNFITPPYPIDINDYNSYMQNTVNFINARNQRIVIFENII